MVTADASNASTLALLGRRILAVLIVILVVG
jgi:hypothetical protein